MRRRWRLIRARTDDDVLTEVIAQVLPESDPGLSAVGEQGAVVGYTAIVGNPTGTIRSLGTLDRLDPLRHLGPTNSGSESRPSAVFAS
jgi:hypothetical protein